MPDSAEEQLNALLAELDVPPDQERRARELLAPLVDKAHFMKGPEVDETLRCSRRTRLRLVNTGFLPELRPGGGNPMYLKLDVCRLVIRDIS